MTELMVDVKVLGESGCAEEGDSSPGSDAVVAGGDGVSEGNERLLMRCMALRLGHSATSEVDTSWAIGVQQNRLVEDLYDVACVISNTCIYLYIYT